MEINILGSGGLNPPPRPGCQCRVCAEARENGYPACRTGHSLFIYDESILFCAPEETALQINRENIDMVENLFLPSWNNEHLSGLRFLERMNYDRVIDNAIWKPVNIFLPGLPDDDHYVYSLLRYYEEYLGIVRLIPIKDCEKIEIGSVSVIPVRLESMDGFYFVLYDSGLKVVYIPSRFKTFKPVSEASNPGYLIAPCHFWRNERINRRPLVNFELRENQIRFEEFLREAESLQAHRIVITHIEEDFGLTFHELKKLPELFYRGSDIEFAWDGMRLPR
jgi:phosphoribosyl 1,2-cyclic phosphate phosphodiesterase